MSNNTIVDDMNLKQYHLGSAISMKNVIDNNSSKNWGVGLNLGCGPIFLGVIDGVRFLNIDNDELYLKMARETEKPESKEIYSFALYDLKEGLPKPILDTLKNKLAFINISQFLEHLNLSCSIRLLRHCYEYLDSFDNDLMFNTGLKKGVIRISVPDTELLIHLFRTNQMDKVNKSQPPEWYNRFNSQMMKFSMILFGSMHETGESGHKMCYNFESLKELLESIGFRNVKRVPYDKRYDAEIAESHQLCVEAIKP